MPRLDDANVADEYGPDRFMPREVDGEEGAGDLGCADCGLRYGSPGWVDASIPDDAWREISPTGDLGGVLCITCMAKRLTIAGRHVPVLIDSGPFSNEPAYWWDRGIERGREFERDDLRQHDAEVARKAAADALDDAADRSDRRVRDAPFSAASLGPWLRAGAARIRRGEQPQPTGRVITTPGGGELTEHDDGALHITKPDERSWTPGATNDEEEAT